MRKTWLVVAAVAAVAVFAAADSLRREPNPPPPPPPLAETGTPEGPDPALASPDAPPPGALAGRLWIETAEGCRLRFVDLNKVRLGVLGPPTECGSAVSPTGQFAVLTDRGTGAAARDAYLASLGDLPLFIRLLGPIRGEAAWSADGLALAWCDPAGTTSVLVVRRLEPERVRGCHPRFGSGQSVLTRPTEGPAEVLLDGEVLLDERTLASAIGDPDAEIAVLGYDATPDGLMAVAVARFVPGSRPELHLELFRGREVVAAYPLPEAGGAVGLSRRVLVSPGGSEVAVSYPRSRWAVVDARNGAAILPPTTARSLAWSPDGSWLALSTGERIDVAGPVRSAPVYVLPVAAEGVAWR